MRRDKYIHIQEPIYTLTDTGGSRSIYVGFWAGWADVEEKNYNTGMEEGQIAGAKGITVKIWKNSKTDKINTSMRIDYRGKMYLINSIREIDRFHLEVIATLKELNPLVTST